MLIKPEYDPSLFLRTAGIDEGDFQFAELPRGMAPEGLEESAEELAPYRPTLHMWEGGGEPIKNLRQDLEDVENIKQVLLIQQAQFRQVVQVIQTLNTDLEHMKSGLDEGERTDELARTEHTLRGEHGKYKDLLNRMFKGMRTASIVATKHEQELWAIGQRVNELAEQLPEEIPIESLSAWLEKANYQGTTEQAMEMWRNYLDFLRDSSNPFLVRFAQAGTTSWQIAMVRLAENIDDMLNELYRLSKLVRDMEVELYAKPVSRAASKKTAQRVNLEVLVNFFNNPSDEGAMRVAQDAMAELGIDPIELEELYELGTDSQISTYCNLWMTKNLIPRVLLLDGTMPDWATIIMDDMRTAPVAAYNFYVIEENPTEGIILREDIRVVPIVDGIVPYEHMPNRKTAQTNPFVQMPQAPTGALETIPIDEEEFARIEFPDNTNIPSSNWWRIIMGGHFRRLIRITYTKVTPPEDGVTSTYTIEPYSFRQKRQNYLFGYDVHDGHIKAFIYNNIHDVEILSETFQPRWEVEFEYKG